MNIFLFSSSPAALQSTCCLPEPWTKHITAPEQHGILLYLPTATPVLPPDPPLLKHPSHTLTHLHTHKHTIYIFIHSNIYTCIHSPHQPHLNECTEGFGDVHGNKPLYLTNTHPAPTPQRVPCCSSLLGQNDDLLTYHDTGIGNTAIQHKLTVETPQ